MTIQELHEYFDLIQDKYNTPAFISSEKDMFINSAQLRFVNDIIFKEILGYKKAPKNPQALYGLEETLNTSELILPLIISDYSISLPTNGIVPKSSIDSIANILAPGTKAMHILNFNTGSNNNYTNNIAFRWIRENDYGKFEANAFKSPASTRPYVKLSYRGYRFIPTPTTSDFIYVSFVRTPIEVSYDNNVTLELPEFTHFNIVALALELAGVATADEILMNAGNLTQ